MFDLLNEFDRHVDNYDISDPMIKLKKYHSYRFMYLCREIAESENLNQEDTYLAIVIGLLHDYARFEQWSKYKTFRDIDSVDHGDLACELLFNNNEIEKFNIDKNYYNIIYNAIKYHNKYSYPDNLDEKTKLFCELIRDADKLDILYMHSCGETKLPTDDSKISDVISSNFYEKKLINKEDVKNVNDMALLKLAMVFDLNFKYSFKYLKDNKILNNILNKIENQELLEPYFEYVKDIIEKREKVYVRKKI